MQNSISYFFGFSACTESRIGSKCAVPEWNHCSESSHLVIFCNFFLFSSFFPQKLPIFHENVLNLILFIIRSTSISNELAARGHNVTVLSADREKVPPKNVHYILLNGLYNDLYHEKMNGFFTFRKQLNPLTAPTKLNEYWFDVCKSNVSKPQSNFSVSSDLCLNISEIFPYSHCKS